MLNESYFWVRLNKGGLPYCIDHSINSLKILSETSAQLSIKNINISLQDVNHLHFNKNFFDIIFGSAVLHHFLDWEKVLVSLLEILKPKGTLIFSEPFASGYLMLANIISQATKILGLNDKDLLQPNYGLLLFIKNDIYSRCNKRDDSIFLNTLIDKHLFNEKDFYSFSLKMNLNLNFSSYESMEFYPHFMTIFLDTYGITEETFRNTCENLYASVYKNFYKNYFRFYPHFQIISLQKK